jgi:protein O-mannosyl-transferase
MTNIESQRRTSTIGSTVWSTVWPLLGLLALIGFLYGNSLANGFVYDDGAYLSSAAVRDFDLPELVAGNWRNLNLYRPAALISIAADRAIWGDRAAGFHLTNLILHAIVCWMVWLLARELLPSRSAAAVAALVCAVHPLQSEVVNWVSARGDLLSTGLLLLGLLAHRRCRTRCGATRAWRVTAALCCALAPLAKETGFLFLPLAWWLDDAQTRSGWLRRGLIWLRCHPEYVVLTAAVLLLRTAILVSGGEAPHSANLLADATPLQRLVTCVAIMGRYAGLVVLPVSLSVDYSFDSIPLSGPTDPWLGIGIAVIGGLVWAARRGPGPLAQAAGVLLICWLPTSNLAFLTPSAMAERYLYPGFFGVGLALGHLAGQQLSPTRRGSRARRNAAILLLTGLLSIWSVRVHLRNRDWHDDGTLFSSVRQRFPHNARALENLGHWHARQGDLTRAVGLYQEALIVRPENPRALTNLASLELRRGRLEEALVAWTGVLTMTPQQLPALLGLAATLERLRRYPAAAERYREVLALSPDHAAAQAGLQRISGVGPRD